MQILFVPSHKSRDAVFSVVNKICDFFWGFVMGAGRIELIDPISDLTTEPAKGAGTEPPQYWHNDIYDQLGLCIYVFFYRYIFKLKGYFVPLLPRETSLPSYSLLFNIVNFPSSSCLPPTIFHVNMCFCLLFLLSILPSSLFSSYNNDYIIWEKCSHDSLLAWNLIDNKWWQ